MLELKELKRKEKKELQKLLAEYREKLRDLRFKISQRQHKDVREFRKIKRQIARVMSLINQKNDN